jgi:hypothetical protein
MRRGVSLTNAGMLSDISRTGLDLPKTLDGTLKRLTIYVSHDS